jgi:phosphoserine phosphatase
MAARLKLAVFDMEGTLTASPTVWEIMHRKRGTWESHGMPYWHEFRAGRIDYDRFAQMDVAAWEGAEERLLEEAVAEVPLMPGCAELLSSLIARGIRCAIISNGLERLGLRLAREHGISRVLANREHVHEGRLTGGLNLLVPYDGKERAMCDLADGLGIGIESVLAVGDGVADVGMFRRAGMSVAFMPENDAVAAQACHVVREPDLRLLLPLV